jgi:protein-tyrosine phosphatase
MTAVLFVCLGNICRSPTAEGVFRELAAREGLAERIAVDSAGTGAWHVGEAPDARAQAAARRRGYDLSAQRARQISGEDFRRFDLILAMDRANLADLRRQQPAQARARLELFLSFADAAPVLEVPDPYYGEGDGFERVLDLVEAASRGLLAHIRSSG